MKTTGEPCATTDTPMAPRFQSELFWQHTTKHKE
jgi:hypothetical protein